MVKKLRGGNRFSQSLTPLVFQRDNAPILHCNLPIIKINFQKVPTRVGVII